MQLSKITLRLIGLLSLALSLWALLYLAVFAGVTYADPSGVPQPHFLLIFSVMTAAVACLELALAWCGWSFTVGRFRAVLPFIVVCVCTGLLPLIIRAAAQSAAFGSAVASSTGITTGGLLAQFVSRFEIWAPIVTLVLWRLDSRPAPPQ